MFRTIMAIVTVFAEFIILTPWMLYCKNLTKKGDPESIRKRDNLAPKLIRFMARGVMWWSGADVTVEGLENIPDTACLYIGNHQSYFDILITLVHAKVMFGYMAKKEIGKVPFLKTWMETIDCVFLDRSNPRQGIVAIKEASEFLKRGQGFCVFPEGTRSKGDRMSEFKTGASMIAAKSKAPVVPFLIDGSYRIFESNGNRLKPTKVTLTFFPPIDISDYTKSEINDLTQKLHDFLENEQKKRQII